MKISLSIVLFERKVENNKIFLFMNVKEKWQDFRNWQATPHEVAPLSNEEHECATCHTEYIGNYCPRCGQSAKVHPKMSLGKTFLMFLDVWGLGNRGMFRTLRDLIFRPGYLIADYINGKHGAYFPPFKLLFLLTTLSLLIGHGFNLNHEDIIGEYKPLDIEFNDESEKLVFGWINNCIKFSVDYPALFELVFMTFIGNFIFLLFRKTKTLGKLSFHEIIIALVYMVDMYLIYLCTVRFIGIPAQIVLFLSFLYIIPLKQLSGYSLFKTVWRALLSIILGFLSILLLLSVVFLIADSIIGN